MGHIEDIEKLIYGDFQFEKVKEYISGRKQHLFKIISRETDELTFSGTLRYFLDPNESHGAGPEFLRQFLHLAVLKKSNSSSRLQIEQLPLDQAFVYRELDLGPDYGRADLIVSIAHSLYLFIEVKLYAPEGRQQTPNYAKYLKCSVKGHYDFVIPCFLTPDGYKPKSKKFIPISFSDLRRHFDKVRESFVFAGRTELLVNDFMEWLRQMEPINEELKAICRTVYRTHQEAIDLIAYYGPPVPAFLEETASVINQEENAYQAHSGKGWLTLSPKCWLKQKENYTKVRLECGDYKGNLSIALVGPKSSGWWKTLTERGYNESMTREKEENLYTDLESWDGNLLNMSANDWDGEIGRFSKHLLEKSEEILGELQVQKLEELIKED